MRVSRKSSIVCNDCWFNGASVGDHQGIRGDLGIRGDQGIRGDEGYVSGGEGEGEGGYD